MRTSSNAPEVIVASQNEFINNCYYNFTEVSLDRTVRQLFIDILQHLQRAFSCFKFNVGKDVFVGSALSQERRMLENVTKYRTLERC